jgi:hypothetical protein
MRTSMSISIFGACAAASLTACTWTSFDDLENTTWVESATKTGDIKSSEYALNIARGQLTPSDPTVAGQLVVIGADPPSISQLTYAANGDAAIPKATILDLQVQYGIQTIVSTPLLISDPASDNNSLIIGSDNGIAVLTGIGTDLKLYQLFNTAEPQPDAATFMLSPTDGKELPLIGIADSVLGAKLPALPANMQQPICKLTDNTNFTAQIRALGTIRNGAADDVLMWDASGKLYKYPGNVFDGCSASGVNASAVLDTGLMPGPGSQILSIGATEVLLQGSGASGGLLAVNASTLTAIGSAVQVPGVASAALLAADGGNYAVAGVPGALDGSTTGGQVRLYAVDAGGVSSTVAAAYNDAQPESDQAFGRGLAVMPYNGMEVLAVAAKNEVFTYFRANLADGSALYDETRQGH